MGILLIVAFGAAAALCTGMALYAWRERRSTPAAVSLAVTLVGCASWSLMDLMTMLLPRAGQVWALKSTFVGIFVVVFGTYALARSIVDPHWRPSRVGVWAMLPGPLVLLSTIMLWPVPGPFYRVIDIQGVGAPHIVYGPMYYVTSGYCYIILNIAYFRMARARWRAAPLFRPQLNSLLIGALVPAVGNVTAIVAPGVFDHRDLTPLLFTATGLIAARALFKQGLLRIIPVAREQVLESISDSVVVIDAHGRIVDVNPSARTLVRRLRPELLDDPVGLDASELGLRSDSGQADPSIRRTIELLPGFHADVRSSVLTDDRGRLLGRVVLCHDISDLVDAQTELQRQFDLVEQLRAELVEQTIRDPLTGVHNRRYLAEALRTALAQADRTGKPVSVLMVDVDHFKRINDECGHQAGDRALVAIGQSLSQRVRPGDTVARFGGEEFLVVLPSAGRVDAVHRAELLREACSTAVAASGDAQHSSVCSWPVTMSIGVASYPDDGRDTDELVAAADRALYAAKTSGRNRVVAAGRTLAVTPGISA